MAGRKSGYRYNLLWTERTQTSNILQSTISNLKLKNEPNFPLSDIWNLISGIYVLGLYNVQNVIYNIIV
jgi:hypothetical protein